MYTLSRIKTYSDSTPLLHHCRMALAAIEFSVLRIGEYPMPSIIDTVNIIRNTKGNAFAEWKNSATSKLFEDHRYKNKKLSSGYFF